MESDTGLIDALIRHVSQQLPDQRPKKLSQATRAPTAMYGSPRLLCPLEDCRSLPFACSGSIHHREFEAKKSIAEAQLDSRQLG